MTELYYITGAQLRRLIQSLENLELGNVCSVMTDVCKSQPLQQSATRPPKPQFRLPTGYMAYCIFLTVLSLLGGIFVRWLLVMFVICLLLTVFNSVTMFRMEREHRKRGMLRYLPENHRGGAPPCR